MDRDLLQEQEVLRLEGNEQSQVLFLLPRIISKRSVHSVLNERSLLAGNTHNFIVNMKYAFQDRENLYLVMDLLTGGDLRFHICCFRKFNEEQTSRQTVNCENSSALASSWDSSSSTRTASSIVT